MSTFASLVVLWPMQSIYSGQGKRSVELYTKHDARAGTPSHSEAGARHVCHTYPLTSADTPRQIILLERSQSQMGELF